MKITGSTTGKYIKQQSRKNLRYFKLSQLAIVDDLFKILRFHGSQSHQNQRLRQLNRIWTVNEMYNRYIINMKFIACVHDMSNRYITNMKFIACVNDMSNRYITDMKFIACVNEMSNRLHNQFEVYRMC